METFRDCHHMFRKKIVLQLQSKIEAKHEFSKNSKLLC